jgi:hypothetical protein
MIVFCLKPQKMDNVNVLIIEDTPVESDALSKCFSYNLVGIAHFQLQLFYANVDVVIIDIFLNGSPDGIAFAETINVVPMHQSHLCFNQLK